MSARSCSLAWAVFFVGQTAAVEKAPQRRSASLYPAFGEEAFQQLADGQVRRRLDQRQQEVAMRIELAAFWLSLSARAALAGLTRAANPDDRCRITLPETRAA